MSTNIAEIAAIRAEAAERDAEWIERIVTYLRANGPATTHILAKDSGAPSGRYFHRFRRVLVTLDAIAKVGEAPGPTGHLNSVWALRDEVRPRR